MNKGTTTFAIVSWVAGSLITSMLGFTGLTRTWVYTPLDTKIDKVNDKVEENEDKVASAIETLGRMDERVKDIDERVEWLVKRFGYVEERPFRELTNATSTQ